MVLIKRQSIKYLTEKHSHNFYLYDTWFKKKKFPRSVQEINVNFVRKREALTESGAAEMRAREEPCSPCTAPSCSPAVHFPVGFLVHFWHCLTFHRLVKDVWKEKCLLVVTPFHQFISVLNQPVTSSAPAEQVTLRLMAPDFLNTLGHRALVRNQSERQCSRPEMWGEKKTMQEFVRNRKTRPFPLWKWF